MAYTEIELEGLSAEERAALLADDEDMNDGDDDADTDDLPEARDDAEDDTDADADESDDTDDDQDTDEPAPTAPAAPAPLDPAALQSLLDEAATTPVTPTPAAPPQPYAPSATASEQIAALEDQLSDGEITLKEYNDKLGAIFTADAQQQVQASNWQRAQEAFFGHPDNQLFTDPVMHAALNAQIQAMDQDPRYSSLSDEQLLTRAAESLRARFAPPAPKADTKPDTRAKARPELPQTLAAIPAADGNSEGDEFAAIDKLDGLALEAAVAKLERKDPEAYRRYLERV